MDNNNKSYKALTYISLICFLIVSAGMITLLLSAALECIIIGQCSIIPLLIIMQFPAVIFIFWPTYILYREIGRFKKKKKRNKK